MDIRWIKISTKMFDDEKIKLIRKMPEGDLIIGVWVQLLIQAGKTNMNGCILLAENIPYSVEMLATIFDRELIKLNFAIKVLIDLKMVTLRNGAVTVCNFEKHQNASGLEKIREQNKLRVAKFRQNQKNVTLQVTHGNATDYRLQITDNRLLNNDQTAKILSDKFEVFYSEYPRKVGKKPAIKAFTKLNPNDELFDKIILSLKQQKEFQILVGDQFTPHPATWLNQERWNDEINISKGKLNGKPKSDISKGSVQSRLDYQYNEDKARERLAELEKQFPVGN